MENDYFQQLKSELEQKNFNMFRFFNEPSEWFDTLYKDLEIWEKQTDIDIFIKTFETSVRWRPEQPARSQMFEYINMNPVVIQFTVVNGGTTLEVAAKRLPPGTKI